MGVRGRVRGRVSRSSACGIDLVLDGDTCEAGRRVATHLGRVRARARTRARVRVGG